MEVTWTELKEFLDNRKLSAQWIEIANRYWIVGFDGPFSLSCNILITDPPNDDQIDFENNFKAQGNKSPKSEVVTQFEKDDKALSLARISGITDEDGIAIAELQIPGDPGPGKGRFVDAGQAWFDNPSAGDHIFEVCLIDKDNILGYGANFEAGCYNDLDVNVENSGWFIPTSKTGVEVTTIAGYGFMPSGLYLVIKAKKGFVPGSPDTLRINLKWGRGL